MSYTCIGMRCNLAFKGQTIPSLQRLSTRCRVVAAAANAAGQGDHGLTLKDYPQIEHNDKELTTNAGTPVPNARESLTAGPRGPVLLEDYALLEKLGQFDRERIPERVFHARGMTAKGYFEVTHDISHLTSAALFNGVGKKTPVAWRGSTATNPKGAPESLRDVRGFAVKFYTEEGNWDLTGNNIPVFFIRDGYLFPDLVHALRPNPVNNIQEAWRVLDFLGSFPESTNIITWLMGDEGIPRNWRTMDGYGVNTFILKNGEKETYVKFHFRPESGAEYMTDEEAHMVGEKNNRHSHATHDLFNYIGTGKEAVWNFYIQTMDIAEGDSGKFGFDPLDCTKEWPYDEFPLQPVGRMALNENVSNFHNESEQIAFSPGTVVPGICLSNDKILQTRAFSYPDTQRYRLGVNYKTLPINAPKFPYHANQEAGLLNPIQKNEQVNYWPSSVEHRDEVESKKGMFPKANGPTGDREKSDYGNGKSIIGDDYKQARDRIHSFDSERLERFKQNLVSWMLDPKLTKEVAETWMTHWEQVDLGFATDVKMRVLAKNFGMFGNPSAVPASKA